MLMSAEMKQNNDCHHQVPRAVKATQLPLGYDLQRLCLPVPLD